MINRSNINPINCQEHRECHIQMFCLSESCERLSAMCKQCIKYHNHDILHTISINSIQKQYLKDLIPTRQQHKLNQIKNSLNIIKNSMMIQFNRFISEIFNFIDQSLQKYESNENNISKQQLIQKKGNEMRKFFIKQNMKKHNKIVDPNLINEMNQFKVILKDLKDKFINLSKISSFFNCLRKNQNQKFQFNFNEIENQLLSLNFHEFNFHPYTLQFNNELKQLKLMNQQKKFQNALQVADRAVKFNPLNSHIYFQKANAFYDLGRFQQSYINYKISMEFDGRSDLAHNNTGLCLKNLKFYNQSLIDLDKSINLNKKYPNPYLNKGLVYQQMNRLYQASACYTKALKIDIHFNNVHPHRNRIINKISQIQTPGTVESVQQNQNN